MLKKIFIILSFFISAVNAEIVKEVKIEGNDRISSETIKVYGDIELGRDYSNIDINNILKNLYSTDFFENIEINFKNDVLNIIVKEYPLINSIVLDGEKSNQIKNSIIKKLRLRPNTSFIESLLVEDINLIKKLYSSVGYNFTKVDTKIEKFSDNRLNLNYTISKGEKTYIKKINFIGDKKLKDNKLRDIIVSEEKKFWKILSKNTYFNQANIDLDIRLLLNYYKSLGYYDVQIISNSAEIKENTSELTYSIRAGNRFRISKISTNVEDVIDKKIFNTLEVIYSQNVGKYYSPFRVKKILDEVDTLIADNDLQFVQHSVNEIISNNEIEIKINIYEGEKNLVEKINITGNTITDEAVIRSELLLDEGDPYNSLKFENSISRLKSRNIFGEIKSNVKDGTKNDQKVLEIAVEEKATGEITAGAGIGTEGGSFAFSISENNWLGKGTKLSTNVEVSAETFTGGISITEPNYNYSGNSLNYFVTNTKNDKPNSGFKNSIFSTGVGTRFEQYKDIYLSPNLIFSYDDLKVESNASTGLKKQKGTFSDLIFDYGITSDKRDRVFGPTDGYIVAFTQSLPVYADSPYIKNSFSFGGYQSFTNDLIGSFKFYASSVNGLNNNDVRISKRIKIPTTRLRGFEAGKVGPKDGEDYVGGNYSFATNFELNLPNLLPESTKTDVGLFLDFGNVWHVDYDDQIDGKSKIRSSIGANTSWLSPIGPMSFVFAKNLSKANTDVTETFNFRIGTTF